MPVRLHKHLAACGIGSRRQCEQWMIEGRISVNGEIVREPGTTIDPDNVKILFNGKPVRPQMFRYIALHKPPGYVCTLSDPQGRPRAIDLVPGDLGRLYTVGRLDTGSEGLIIITNDGDFAHRLMHPRHEIHKEYELWLHAPLSAGEIAQWRRGVLSEGETLRVLALASMPPDRGGYGYRIRLGEGRNRHLRRMAQVSGKKVLRLKRVAIGHLRIGSLKRGAWRVLSQSELREFQAQGPR